MTILDQISSGEGAAASRLREILGTGIPWSSFALSAQQDVYGKVEYTVALREEMRKVFAWADTISWTWDVVNGPERADALLAWSEVRSDLVERSDVIDAALSVGTEKLGLGEAPQWKRETLRAFFSQMFSLAMRGFQVHTNIIMQLSRVPAADIVRNADLVFFVMRGLNRLHAMGALEPFKKGASVSGASVGGVRVGAAIAPGVAAVIAVATVAALIVMAWFITKMTVILAQWELTSAACLAAIQNPANRELADACQKAQTNLQGVGKTKGPLNTLAVFGGIGIAILAVGYGLKAAGGVAGLRGK